MENPVAKQIIQKFIIIIWMLKNISTVVIRG